MADHEKDHHGGDEAHGEHKKHKKHHHQKHEEHEHEEGWIVSFADNVLLMMGFFVILLAQNMGPKGTSNAAQAAADDRVIDAAIAIREAFNSPVDINSKKPEDQPLVRRLRERQTTGDSISRGPDGKAHSPQAVRPTDWAGPGGFVQFSEHDTRLTSDGIRTIAQLAEKHAGSKWIFEVRGHASKREAYDNNRKGRDLSYNRAWAVAEELVKRGVSWNQIRLVSAGDTLPVVARAKSGDETATNQRAEILILNETVPSDPYLK
jgi:flagellar motor protein MotB